MYKRFIDQLEKWYYQYLELMGFTPDDKKMTQRMLALETEIILDRLSENVKKGYLEDAVGIVGDVIDFQMELAYYIQLAAGVENYELLIDTIKDAWKESDLI